MNSFTPQPSGPDTSRPLSHSTQTPETGSLKLLFLLPFAPDLRGSHGGARATAAMVDMLSRVHRVRVLYLSTPNDPAPRQLPPQCESVLPVPVEARAVGRRHGGKVGDAIADLLWSAPKWVEECRSSDFASQLAAVAAEFEPDIAHFEFHVMAQFIPVVRAASARTKCVVTEHEPGVSADGRPGAAVPLRQRLAAFARQRAWARYERRVLPLADAIIVFTDNDSAAVQHLLGSDAPPITVIPLRIPSNGPPADVAATAIKSDFLFVGSFRHPPNADAARRLVNEIFPLILDAAPSATLTIVGADPPADVSAAASEHVTVTGWVDDPAVYLAGASVVLVPLRQGGGLRVKMLEACAAGKAIVASQMAIEGLSLRDGEQVVLAETDKEFADRATALLSDAGARSRLEQASLLWSQAQEDVGEWAGKYAAFHSALVGDDAQ